MINIIFLILTLLMPLKHPIHVSMTNIDYNKTEKNYNIIIKVFTDDFEKNIYKIYNITLNTNKSNESEKYNEVVTKYINSNLKIYINNKNQKLKYISKRTNFEATWLNFKLLKIAKKDDNIKITNNIMNQFYRDQTNLLIFTKNDLQKAFNMNYTDTIVKFKLN